MRQLFKVSILALFFGSNDTYAQRKKKKPRNIKLERSLVGNWKNQKEMGFPFNFSLKSGNKSELYTAMISIGGTYMIRGKKLIFKGRPIGAPTSVKKETFRFKIVSIQGNVLTLKTKNGIAKFNRQ